MKYYPNDSAHIDYVEMPENTIHNITVKTKNFSGFIDLQNSLHYLKEDLGDQMTVRYDVANRATHITFAENSNYITFFRVLIRNDLITKDFSSLLYHAQLSRVYANTAFQSPLANQPTALISPTENKSEENTFNLKV